MKNQSSLPSIFGAVVVAASSSHAAVIAAGVDQFADNDPAASTLVNTTGDFDIAINFGDTSNTTINTVTFTGYVADWIPDPAGPPPGTSVTSATGVTVSAGTAISDMRDIPNFGLWGGATFAGLAVDLTDASVANGEMNFTIGGLNSARSYRMQFFSLDGRALDPAAWGTDITYELGGVSQTGRLHPADGLSDGIIANFDVSGETSVDLTITGSGGIPTIIQGLSIHSIPEPGSSLLVALAGWAFLMRRRR